MFKFKAANHVFEEETPDKYTSAGFLPVRIGDLFNHYKVVHKLGYGAYSTVWLAEDVR